MVIDAYSVKLGGLRSYAHGMISIGAVRFDGECFTDEFHLLMKPENNLGYQPGALKLANTSLQDMEENGVEPIEAVCQFLWWAQNSIGVWTLDPGAVDFINVPIRKLNFMQDYPDWDMERSKVPERFIRELKAAKKFKTSADINGLYDVLKALGVIGPVMANKEALMTFAGVDAFEYEFADALEQAKLTAMTFFGLYNKLSHQFSKEGGLLDIQNRG